MMRAARPLHLLPLPEGEGAGVLMTLIGFI